MSIKTTKQRLLDGEQFTIRRSHSDYSVINVYYIHNCNHENAQPEYEIRRCVYQGFEKVKIEGIIRFFRVSEIEEDHFIIYIVGMLCNTRECIPYSSIVFIDDLKAELTQTPKVN